MIDDPYYSVPYRVMSFRISAIDLSTLQHQLASAPIPAGYSASWYYRRLLMAIPAPELPPDLGPLLSSTTNAAITRLATILNDKVRILHTTPSIARAQTLVLAIREAIAELITRALADQPAGYDPDHYAPIPRRGAGIPRIMSDQPAELYPILDAPKVHIIRVRLAVAAADDVTNRARGYNAFRRGMLSELLRRMIHNLPMPRPAPAVRYWADPTTYGYLCRIRGTISQLSRRGGDFGLDDAYTSVLKSCRAALDTLSYYVMARGTIAATDLPISLSA